MKTLSLVRATLRGTTWISSDGLRELGRKDRLWVLPLAGAGVLVGVGVLVFMITGVYRSLLATGTIMGHPEMEMFYALLGSWAFLFLTGIPLVLSVLYYSSDMRMLLTLPVAPFRIVGAKAFLVYLYCLPVNFVLLVPAIWLFVVGTGFSPSIVVAGLVSLFLLPVFPLSLATLFVLVLMKVVNLSRFRVALEVGGMALAIVLLVGLQIVLSRVTMASVLGGSTSQALGGFPDFYAGISGALPPVAWAAAAFVSGAGPFPTVLAILVTSALFALTLVLAPVNFLHDVMERREAGSRKDRRHAVDGKLLAGAPQRVVPRLVGREWSVLSSNSTFIFEAIGELLVLPILLVVYGFIIPKELLGQVMSFARSMPALALALMGVVVLMTSLTTVSATSISREGRRMGLSLTIPVPGRVQVRAKLWFHMLFFSSAYLVDLVIVWVIFRFPLVSLLFMVPGGIALQVADFAVNIYFDLKRPVLKWTHPQQAMKSNMNAMSGIGSCVGIVAILGLPSALLVLRGIDPFLVGCGVVVVAIGLAALLLTKVLGFADRQYGGGMELEV
jgi:ABC-2 type transport system permease protein